MTGSAERVEFFTSCQDLTSHRAFVAVYLKDTASNTFLEIGQSETSYNGNPKFTKQFLIDFIFEEEQQLRFDIYKSVNGATAIMKKNLLGSCSIKLSEVIHSKCQMLTRTLTNGRKVVKNRSTKRYSRLNIRLEPVSSDRNENVEFQFGAYQLPKQGTFKKCNPVMEIHRLGSDGKYFKVYETEKLSKTLNPTWKRFQLTSQGLCNNDFVRPLQFKIFHAEKDIRKYVGKIQTSYQQLRMEKQRKFELKNTKGHPCGSLECRELILLSSNNGSMGSPSSNIPNTKVNRTQSASSFALEQKTNKNVNNSSIQASKMSNASSMKFNMVSQQQTTNQQISRGQFLRYLGGACEISLMLGIDFTGSNGYVNDPKSLHYIYGGKPSPYQQALRNICQIVAPYDSDQKFPLWGFGAKFLNMQQVVHDFALSPNGDEVDGVAGIEQAYVNAINSGSFQLSGPTYYSPILAKALNICVAAHNKVMRDVTQTLPVQYFIFLLITNGNICDEDRQQTRNHIVYAANNNLPLSVIIIGVGDGKFDFLNEFETNAMPIKDKDGNEARRNIVQFVQMNKFAGKPLSDLSKYTLREVPTQFMSYVNANNIKPRTAVVKHEHNWHEAEQQPDSEYDIPEELAHSVSIKSDVDDGKENATQESTTNYDNMAVPAGWEKSYTASGRVFYINHNTRKTQWVHPLLTQQQVAKQPKGEQLQPGNNFNRASSMYVMQSNTAQQISPQASMYVPANGQVQVPFTRSNTTQQVMVGPGGQQVVYAQQQVVAQPGGQQVMYASQGQQMVGPGGQRIVYVQQQQYAQQQQPAQFQQRQYPSGGYPGR